jgi:hypothetical protein
MGYCDLRIRIVGDVKALGVNTMNGFSEMTFKEVGYAVGMAIREAQALSDRIHVEAQKYGDAEVASYVSGVAAGMCKELRDVTNVTSSHGRPMTDAELRME